MPSHFRGPLRGAIGVAREAPASFLDRHIGRTKVVHNDFSSSFDITKSATPLSATPARLMALPIVVDTSALTIVTQTATSAFAGMPCMSITYGTADTNGVQLTQVGASNGGYFASLGGGVARNFDPPLVLTFSSELALTANGINNCFTAFGLFTSSAACMDGAGALTQSGSFCFYIPRGAAGVSGAVRTVWAANGAVQEDTVISPGLTMTTENAVRFAIRVSVRDLSAAASPLTSATEAEFYVNENLVRRMSSADGLEMPLSLAPGIAGVRITTAAGNVAKIPYWVSTFGPIRSGPTTV